MSEITPDQLSKLATKFKEQLAEADAQLYEQLQATYVSLTGDAELPRYWPELSPDSIPDAIDYLNMVTSVKNTVPLRYVDDPMANQEVYRGRWRQAFIRRAMQGEVTKLVQVLRRGYAEQINWDEARIRTARWLQDQPTGTNTSDYECYLEIFWPNCSISKLEEMANSLRQREFVNPVIESEVRAGTWHNQGVTTQKADDGSGIITLSLTISHFRLDGFLNWLTHRTEDVIYLWGYAKDEAQAIGEAWKSKGHSCRFMFEKTTGLVDIILSARSTDPLTVSGATGSWDCRYKEIVDYYFGVDDPTLYPISTQPANGISYTRNLRDNGDGSWDIIVTTRYVQYRDIPFQVSRIVAGITTETRQQLGLTTQDLEDMSEEDGITKDQRLLVRDDCSKDAVTDKNTVSDIPKTSHDNDGLVRRTIEDHSAAAADLPDEIPPPGQRIKVDNQHTEFPGRTRTRRIVEESQYILGDEYVARFGERSTDYLTEVEHDLNPPVIVDLTGSFSETAVLAHNLDDFLTHNYKKLRSVSKFPISDADNALGVSWPVYGDLETVSVQDDYVDTSVWPFVTRSYVKYNYVYQTVYTHTLKYFHTAHEAADWIADVTTSALPDDPNSDLISSGIKTQYDKNFQSRFDKTGEFEWQAIKVVTTHSLRYTYHYPTPS
jgi:hypothetical protein